MPKKKKRLKRKKQDSIGGLLARIGKIEKKLDLLNIMSKSMPSLMIACFAVLGAFVYLSLNATIPEINVFELLPQTGEDVGLTQDFVILYPENGATISLPDEISGLSINGFYDATTKVIFYAQKDTIVEIGEGVRGKEVGEYTVNWAEAQAGQYHLWAEIENADGVRVRSAAIVFTINPN